jgi:LPXTG-motif cell wall-anchored protein
LFHTEYSVELINSLHIVMNKKLIGATALAFLLFSASVASAQSTTTPGTPDTGTGGDAATTLTLMGVAAVVALGGAAYLARSKQTEA